MVARGNAIIVKHRGSIIKGAFIWWFILLINKNKLFVIKKVYNLVFSKSQYAVELLIGGRCL